MSNALAVYQNDGFELMQRAAGALVASGFFKDSKDKAQAIVKIMAGAELGIQPFAAMTGIHIVQGRPVLSSNLIATLVKNDPRYNYRVRIANDTECVLTWLEDGRECGTSSFTLKEAQAAGLTGKAVWQQYPSDMLFARALTRGARRFAPGIFGGAPVYTAEEIGADVTPDGDIDTATIGDWESAEPSANGSGAQPEPVPVPAPAQPKPMSPAEIPLTARDDYEMHITYVDEAEWAALGDNAGRIADVRATLADHTGRLTLGTVADKAAQTGRYNAAKHALNAMRAYNFPEGVTVEMAQVVSRDGALKVFDWLMGRKETAAE